MPVDISEKDFEAQIEHVLRNQHGYHKRLPEDYDRHLCLIPADVIDFIRGTQTEAWRALRAVYQDEAESRFLRRLASEIDKRGTLAVLRNGLRDAGADIKLAYFAPATAMNPDYQRLYEGNIFAVLRQLQYKPGANLSLDLALFLNGLPIFTAELKNNFTGQNAQHAMRQYQRTRDPNEPLFKFGRCLAHFAVDPDLVYVTTHLRRDSTFFLPFNKGKYGGAGNPPAHDNFATHYLWEEVWARDSLLNLLAQFIYISDKDGKKEMIFPRYHQLDAVRRLIADARENGAGQRYLIQHSAGSGKSYSIAWLAHQLANLHNARDQKVFDTVVVITDRRVLDRQLQAAIRQFEQTRGLVENIDRTSRQLKQALEDGKRIIVTTLQKFPYVVDEIGKLSGSAFAVIVDEAHSSQSGEGVKSLKATLTPGAHDDAETDEDDPDPPTWEDAIVESMRARKQPANISMFAFTATPKNKTLELFGRRRPDGGFEAFSLYSMRQAIDERFILDVLENYTTYKSYWRLLKKIDEDPEYPSGKAKRLLTKFVDAHPESIGKKVEIIVEHFREHVMPQIRNKAKAMIVTRSRLHAVRAYIELTKYLRQQGYEYGALVAFSGAVNDGGVEFTETKMNNIPEAQTASAFDQNENRFLVVAEKFQTGFDQPLLAAMYVDKPLKGVHAVQTLSRLNRIHPQKASTIALDFVNQAQHIQEAFKPYYEATILSEGTDHNLLYDRERALMDHHFFTRSEVDEYCAAFYSKRVKQQDLRVLLAPVVERVQATADEEGAEFRSDLTDYNRLYAFLSQIIPFEDVGLEKLYAFARHLRRLLPADREQLPTEILDNIDIDSYRLRQTSEGSLTPEPRLEMLEPMLESEKYGASEDRAEPLSEIIQFLNEVFGDEWQQAYKTVTEVKQEVSRDPGVSNAIRINPPDKARPTVDDAVIDAITKRYKSHFKFFKRVNDDPFVKGFLLDWFFDELRQGKNDDS
ncbi:MAG: DEAD/DEAH box helicase family protein [Chloroflexi bacterium]|nr:DEAD/DEAH box helicase family protein [Chloroflexota bacterium]